jgi:DNA invertase Pin-like site-specific DNA recombinase
VCGRVGGRPAIGEKTKRHIVTLFYVGECAADIARAFYIGRSTVSKILNMLTNKI